MDGLRSAAVLLFLTLCVHTVVIKAAGDVCQQPVQRGDCRAYIPSFFYNSISGECEKFIYGGCGGNDNRFPTMEACQARCSASGNAGDVCQQPVQQGDCRAYIPSFFYNSISGECEKFIYGGCGGNDNRFPTMEACQARCSASRNGLRANTFTGDVCQLPAVTGDCRAYFLAHFYNSKTGACERFIYGGCGGNGNKFQTLEACQAKCLKKVNACQQPAKPGNCYAYIPSYFFNSTSRACEQFVYGGCGGNDNRFQSIQECRTACNSRTPIPLLLS